MNLPTDKDFDLAVEKAIDEIFGGAEEKTGTTVVEDDSLKTSLELEPLELENNQESKVIDFPNIDELLETDSKKPAEEQGLTQEELERLAAAVLSLEWELSPETAFEFLTVLEEAKQKSDPKLHEIFELMHEVGTWLKERPEEARPEWLHFLHQGVVALNLVTLHGKDVGPYVAHLKKALKALKQAPKSREEKLLKDLLRQVTADYQRFILLDWLFSQIPRLKPWQGICQKSLQEIEALVQQLPEDLRPNLEEIAESARKRLKTRKATRSAPKDGTRQAPKEQRETAKLLPPPFTEAYFCRLGEENIVVPAEQVCYVGKFKESWRSRLEKGFPLKLILGFWAHFSFIKLKNKLMGELAKKSEIKLRKMVLPVLKESPTGGTLLIIWKDGEGGVLIVDEAAPQSIPEDAKFISGEKGSFLVVKGQKFPVVEVR
ncbi:MAG: hypothetical protein GXO17_06110 [Thermodesulfobacteria bacterium]|nr:hypothetical protein [Thermodesulfobacteriota bacterium]